MEFFNLTKCVAALSPRFLAERREIASGRRPELRFFTLVEIMVVLAIIILVSAVSYPFLAKPSSKLALGNAANKIVSVMSTARFQASLRGAARSVVYDPDSKTFMIVENKTKRDDGNQTSIQPKSFYVAADKYSIPVDIDVAFPDAETATRKFTFYPDGTASSNKIHLTLKGSEFIISISNLTGIARIFDETEE